MISSLVVLVEGKNWEGSESSSQDKHCLGSDPFSATGCLSADDTSAPTDLRGATPLPECWLAFGGDGVMPVAVVVSEVSEGGCGCRVP